MSVIIGIVTLIGALLVPFVVEKYGRRLLLLLGTFIIFICLILISIFSMMKLRIPATIAVFIYAFVYSWSLASLSWIFITDLLPDIGIGCANFLIWLMQLLITFIFPLIANPDALDLYGAFFIFAGIIFVAFFFFLFYVPETKGKTKSEI